MAWLRNYVFQTVYQWIVDHEMTPYLLVDAESPGVELPRMFVEDGRMVFSLAPLAIRDLVMDEEGFSFDASFSGDAVHIFVPYLAALSLYSKETGQGVYSEETGDQFGLFINEINEDTQLPDPPESKKKDAKKLSERVAKRGFKVVK